MVASRRIEYRAERVIPNMFEELVGFDRTELLEVSCEHETPLVEAFRSRSSRSDAAHSCALLNGHDIAQPEGLRLVVEQILSLKPKHVWISLPGKAFSTLQNINQRTPTQVQDLKAKRTLAIRTFESTVEITKVCRQAGIHVTVELSERSEAWRLPVLQKLRFESGLLSCVVKGCAVGLRGSNGKLMQKGWRILTTHPRLASKLHKPCPCHTKYEHAKCEGPNAKASSKYPPEFVRLVHEALTREGGFDEVVQECQGRSGLPEDFGKGLGCACEVTSEGCGVCKAKDFESECGQRDLSLEAHLSQHQVRDLETTARSLHHHKEPQLSQVQELLQQFPLKNIGHSRRNQGTPNDYHVFGTYAYGNHYGNTTRTQNFPELCKLINKVLKKHLPSNFQRTSVALNHGTMMPIHRDSRNDPRYPNGSIGFGNFSGGSLWIEEGGVIQGKLGLQSQREGPQGQKLDGVEVDIQGQVAVFLLSLGMEHVRGKGTDGS